VDDALCALLYQRRTHKADESHKSTKTPPRRGIGVARGLWCCKACQKVKYEEIGIAEAIRAIPRGAIETWDKLNILK
jgi:hypothetical protein